MVRSGNEDSLFADATPYRGVFMVADGMGGHAAGEIASEMAVAIVTRDLAPVHNIATTEGEESVRRALREANRAIFERTLAEVDKQGMGTTASVLMLSGGRYLIGQIGPLGHEQVGQGGHGRQRLGEVVRYRRDQAGVSASEPQSSLRRREAHPTAGASESRCEPASRDRYVNHAESR